MDTIERVGLAIKDLRILEKKVYDRLRADYLDAETGQYNPIPEGVYEERISNTVQIYCARLIADSQGGEPE